MSFIKETIQRFGELLGLFANLRKSSIFLVGVNSVEASPLEASMGFMMGHLPNRYLGFLFSQEGYRVLIVIPLFNG